MDHSSLLAKIRTYTARLNEKWIANKSQSDIVYSSDQITTPKVNDDGQ